MIVITIKSNKPQKLTKKLKVYLSSKRTPIVDDHTGSDDVSATVNGAGDKGDLGEETTDKRAVQQEDNG